MDDTEFAQFLVLLMCCDPWPVVAGDNQFIMKRMADRESAKRGFKNWVDAYHNFNNQQENHGG